MAASQAPGSDSESKQVLLIVLSVLLMVVATLGISFRLYSRFFVLKKAFAEDVLMLIGTVFAFGLSVLSTIGAFHGFGANINDAQRDQANLVLLYDLIYASTFVYAAATLFIKFSFLMLYHRIDDRTPMRWTVYTLVALIIGQAFATMVLMSLTYIPPSKLFGDLDKLPAICQAFWNAMDIVSAVSSIAVYVTPLFILRGLRLPKRQKWGVAALLGLGILPVVASCIKTYYVWQLYLSQDVYYQIVNATIWTQVEVHLAILCGSVQTYRALLKGFCPRCCRSPSDGCATDPEHPAFPPRSPPLSNAGRNFESPTGTVDSWSQWEPAVSEVSSAYMKGRISTTPSPVGINGVATLPAGVRPQFPNIATRIGGDRPNVWLYEAPNDKRFSTPWPLR